MPMTLMGPLVLTLATLAAAVVLWRAWGRSMPSPVSAWHLAVPLPGILLLFMAPSTDKGAWALAGLLLGAGLAFLSERLGLPGQVRWTWWIPLGFVGLFLPPVVTSYAWLGFLAGWSAVALSLSLERADHSLASVCQGAVLVASAIWGLEQNTLHGLGAIIPWAAGTLALSGRLCPWRWAPLPLTLGGVALLIVASQQPVDRALLLPLAAGLAVATALAYLPTFARRQETFWLVALGLGGLLLVLARLWGMWGVALGGLGLLAGEALALQTGQVLMAGRVLLQLFLVRTGETLLGVDLTHPYAYAALGLGLVLPMGLRPAALPWAPLLAAGSLSVAPLIGFFFHLEAMSSYLAALVLVSLVARLEAVQALVAGSAAAIILAAPWMVQAANAPRLTRIVWLVGLVIGAWLCSLPLIWRKSQRS